MNERVRLTENGVPPDPRAPAQNLLLFPARAAIRAAPRPRRRADPQRTASLSAISEPHINSLAISSRLSASRLSRSLCRRSRIMPQPPMRSREPAAFATIDDAVAQIAARQRALDGDPAHGRPSAAAASRRCRRRITATGRRPMRRRNIARRLMRRRCRPMPLRPMPEAAALRRRRRRPARICPASKRSCATSPPRSRPCASRCRISPARCSELRHDLAEIGARLTEAHAAPRRRSARDRSPPARRAHRHQPRRRRRSGRDRRHGAFAQRIARRHPQPEAGRKPRRLRTGDPQSVRAHRSCRRRLSGPGLAAAARKLDHGAARHCRQCRLERDAARALPKKCAGCRRRSSGSRPPPTASIPRCCNRSSSGSRICRCWARSSAASPI